MPQNGQMSGSHSESGNSLEARQELRLGSIDVVRGAVMILMALDHVRDFFSKAAFAPLDLTQTTPALFFTRWVTHFCAPAFVLLAGASAFLWGSSRSKSRPELAGFLLTRGLWLIVLELTVVRLAWFFNLDYEFSLAQVIWAIGWSMIVLAALVFLPKPLILAFAFAMIAGHNLLDSIAAPQGGFTDSLWMVLHQPGPVEILPGHQLFILYPLVPWMGVMALGYALRPLFLLQPAARRRAMLVIGISLTVAFFGVRALNGYGDPSPWSAQKDAVFTFLSFLNVEKYPPSLIFLLMTLGPVLIALALLDRPMGSVPRILAVYGRVPLFFYVIHLFLIHGLAIALARLRFGDAHWLIGAAWLTHAGYPPDYGYDLPGVYLIWSAVAAALYPACKWFADLKRRRPTWWLSYL